MLIARHECADQFRSANNWTATLILKRLDKWRDHTLDSLLNDMRRVFIILAEGVGTHESENWHNAVFDDVGGDVSKGGKEEKGTVLDLWGCGRANGINENIGADTGIEIYGFGVLGIISSGFYRVNDSKVLHTL